MPSPPLTRPVPFLVRILAVSFGAYRPAYRGWPDLPVELLLPFRCALLPKLRTFPINVAQPAYRIYRVSPANLPANHPHGVGVAAGAIPRFRCGQKVRSAEFGIWSVSFSVNRLTVPRQLVVSCAQYNSSVQISNLALLNELSPQAARFAGFFIRHQIFRLHKSAAHRLQRL